MVKITFADGSTLLVDASLRQSHGQSNQVTDYPAEDGSNVTDNIRARPRTYTLEGVISATPIVDPGTPPPTNPHMAAYKRLQAAANSGKTIGISSGLGSYKTMAIENLSIPRDPETGVDLYFTLMLKEIRLASTKTTTVPASALGDTTAQRTAQARKNRGIVAATKANASQTAAAAKAKANAAHKPQDRSDFYKLTHFILGQLGQ